LWLLEIRAGVYIGNYNITVRDMIWRTIIRELDIVQGSAIMAYNTNNEMGFEFQIFGDNRRQITEFDGIKFVSFMPSEV
jgi:CRISPR-associated protein Cas2